MKATLSRLERLARIKAKGNLDIARVIKSARESQSNFKRNLDDISEPLKSRLERAYKRIGIRCV